MKKEITRMGYETGVTYNRLFNTSSNMNDCRNYITKINDKSIDDLIRFWLFLKSK